MLNFAVRKKKKILTAEKKSTNFHKEPLSKPNVLGVTVKRTQKL